MGAEKMRLLGRHARAFAVGNASAGGQGSSLAAQRELRGFLAGHAPRVKQVQIGALLGFEHDVGRVGQGGKRVFGREAGNVVGRLHRLLNCFCGEIGRARVATSLTQIDSNAQ